MVDLNIIKIKFKLVPLFENLFMRLFFYFVISISFCSCYPIERNCLNYHTGNYKSDVIIDGINYTSTFSRSKNVQVEKFEGKVDSSMVRWINDCEVIFKTINPKNMAERKDIHLKILSTTDSTYQFEYSYVGDVQKAKGVARRLN